MGNLVPGNLKPSRPPNPAGNATDYSLFTNSLADEIEKQLDALMQGDDLPPLNMDANDRSVRDRRRLFVAIARGIVSHLAANPDAFKITTNTPGVTAAVTSIATS